MLDRNLAEDLQHALQGDANAMVAIATADQASLRDAESRTGALVVKRAAAVSILRGFDDGRFSPVAVQAWASFVRRGFVGRAVDGPIRPIDIEFEDAWEDAISATVSRLDEIGDVIDGEVPAGEVLDLLQLLGEP